ncbi:uncharacterized protein LACBIDRAFT_310833 [Laccaria bicolor S238N-H82]|uniref:Predicted protein n=1 Tax=Laccaria bicolor (strain S238N-H82 / ATCC MYA-4686) TaxID=486041 RepID=B0DV67_LACBS|nr:uncharacterized protein LACBIDRAFT_310833 [Laccaria bicolor S238N-H82]EDR01459.1 predicted protein [Laccaria bicolor S238N-H82]|eukprot:XP_001887811.1 predicted protein [Laccaria bicolor S238N-H82]
MALAQNHIHFLGVPGIPAGEAKIFVIQRVLRRCPTTFLFRRRTPLIKKQTDAFMQPDPQMYTGSRFPTMHDRTASFFKETDVQTKFAFIPDDGSATYIIDVHTNTTQTFTGPTIKDSSATYAASTSALVQLSSSGVISWMGYDAASIRHGRR